MCIIPLAIPEQRIKATLSSSHPWKEHLGWEYGRGRLLFLLLYISVCFTFPNLRSHFKIEVKLTSDKINNFKVHNSMAFGIFIMLCNNDYLITEYFHHLKENPVPTK